MTIDAYLRMLQDGESNRIHKHFSTVLKNVKKKEGNKYLT